MPRTRALVQGVRSPGTRPGRRTGARRLTNARAARRKPPGCVRILDHRWDRLRLHRLRRAHGRGGPVAGGTPPALPVRRDPLRLVHMITRTFFAVLFIGFPLVLGIKIRAQRRALGRSPVVLGRVGQSSVELWFERLSPFGLLFWPAVWLWTALGLAPLRPMPLRAAGVALVAAGAALSAGSVFL